jgi:hypothetical protein
VRGVRVTPETASSRTAAWASGRHQDTWSPRRSSSRDGRKIFTPWEGFTTQVVTLWCFNKVRPAVTDHREHCRRDAPRTDRFGFVVVSRARHGSTRPARRNSELYSVGQSVGLDPERRGVCNPPRPAGRAPGSTRARPAGPPIWRGNVCTTMRGGRAGPRAGPRG